MNNNTTYVYTVLGLAGALLLFLVVAPAYSPLYVSNTDNIPMNVIVVAEQGQAGVANDQNNLQFGEVSTGVNVTKFVTVQNGEKAAKIRAQASGGIAPFISIDRNEPVLAPHESANLTVTFRSGQPGSFTGTLILQQIAPRSEHLSFLVRFL